MHTVSEPGSDARANDRANRPCGKSTITPPAMNPAGSCGGAGLGSAAKTAALTPIKPIVQTTLNMQSS